MKALLRDDPYLTPFMPAIERRARRVDETEVRLTGGAMRLEDFAAGHEYYGLRRDGDEWVFREWAPNASAVCVVGQFNGWQPAPAWAMRRINATGDWELRLPGHALAHGDLYRLRVEWHGGGGDRIPAWARRVVQDPVTGIFNAQLWRPPAPFPWKHPCPRPANGPVLVYEAHVGMAQEEYGVGTYDAFRRLILPRIADAGYNTIQLMAIMEHPYYGSFGYHVANFFAASSRFGSPDDLKALIDDAHGAGLRVIMDLVHSHSVRNEVEGLSRFDGTPYQYFHDGPRGEHRAWDSRCFDYGKPQVLHFLLSNCRFWLDEYRLDGFRFDGVTSMLYHHHGMGPPFARYDTYFDDSVDEDALTYLALANRVIHAVRPDAVTVAEDVSGMPGLAAPAAAGGVGFDCRLAMGIPDCWFKLAAEVRDEDWNLGWIWHELNNRRADERTISYVECHDQAIVGSKTMIFQLCDAAMYHAMRVTDAEPAVDRGVALHKMMRLCTLLTADAGYLNFMGNEFGHPEWIDFPRQGNNASYHYARRQWRLRDDPALKYGQLAEFDRAMLEAVRDDAALWREDARLLHIHESDKVIAFQRAGWLAAFNFHPTRSVVDYAIETSPAEYALALDTDEPRFGGQGRIQPAQRYVVPPRAGDDPGRPAVLIYLPCRTALLMRAVQPCPRRQPL